MNLIKLDLPDGGEEWRFTLHANDLDRLPLAELELLTLWTVVPVATTLNRLHLAALELERT